MPLLKESHATADFEFDGHGILIVNIKDDIELSEQDIIQHREIAARLTGTSPHAVLAIVGERTQASDAARKYAAGNVPAGRVAEAVVVRSLPVRILANFYLKYNKPGVLTKMFNERDEAVQWLRDRLKAGK